MIRTPKINLIHGDCLDLMRETPSGYYDLAIVDPPYGIDVANMNMGLGKGKRQSKDKNRNWSAGEWDKNPPDEKYFNELFRVSKNQIVWGGNYFGLPATQGFVVWDKGIDESLSFSQIEYAWTSFQRAAKMLKYSVYRDKKRRFHPTQKPISLYTYLLQNYAKPGDKILDTHLGSMSIAIACFDLGFDLTGTELDKDYYDAGVARFERHRAQGQLFHAPAIQLPEQQKMF